MATTVQEQQMTKTALPPGPRKLPYIGNLLSLRQDPLGFLQQLQRTYGNMATIYVGKNPAVLLFRPEHVRYVLVEHPRNFSNRRLLQDNSDGGFASEGLLTIDGEQHRQQRRAVQPAFQKKRDEREHHDVLSMLLSAQDGEQPETKLTDKQVHDHILTFLAAGHETTAIALTWMQNCAAGQTRAHSAERRSKLQCMTSLSPSVPRAFSPQPRWLFLADPLPIRRAPTG